MSTTSSRASRIKLLSWLPPLWKSISPWIWRVVAVDFDAFDWDGAAHSSQGWTLDGIYSFDPTNPAATGTQLQSFDPIPLWQNTMDSLSAPGIDPIDDKGAIAANLYFNPLINMNPPPPPPLNWRIDFVSPDVSSNSLCQNAGVFMVQEYSASVFYQQYAPPTGPISVQLFLIIERPDGTVVTLPNPAVSTHLNPAPAPSGTAQWQKITASTALSLGETVQKVIVRIVGDVTSPYGGYVVLDTLTVKKSLLVRRF